MKILIRKLLLESTEIKNIKYNTVEAKFVELRRKIRFQRLRIIRRSSIYISSKFRSARRKRYATVPEITNFSLSERKKTPVYGLYGKDCPRK